MKLYQYAHPQLREVDSQMLPELLGLETGETLAAIGSGGKTSLLFHLGRQLAARGQTVFLGTSTKMRLEQETCCEAELALKRLQQLRSDATATAPAHLVHAGARLPNEPAKITAFAENDMLRLCEAADNGLIEADGSRGLPLKVCATDEPVLYPWLDRLLLCAGLSAIGQAVHKVCHRSELLSERLGLCADSLVNAALFAEILQTAYLRPLAAAGDRLTLCLTQADELADLASARAILRQLPWAAKHRVLLCSFNAGERHLRSRR